MSLTQAEIKQLKTDVEDVKGHVSIMNREQGELRDAQVEFNKCLSSVKNEISGLKTDMTKVKTDMEWIKKFFWLVASSSVGALVVGMMNLLISR